MQKPFPRLQHPTVFIMTVGAVYPSRVHSLTARQGVPLPHLSPSLTLSQTPCQQDDSHWCSNPPHLAYQIGLKHSQILTQAECETPLKRKGCWKAKELLKLIREREGPLQMMRYTQLNRIGFYCAQGSHAKPVGSENHERKKICNICGVCVCVKETES